MTTKPERLHLVVEGATRAELGRSRGAQLRDTLGAAYAKYAELFRASDISEAQEHDAVERTLAVLGDWRPEVVAELEGIAEASGVPLAQVVALNARTEILALGEKSHPECSTVAACVGAGVRADGTVDPGRMMGVQTWDWHVELDPFWHTHEVAGPGYRFAGVTEQGILGKIGVNSAGLATHFNILAHTQDGPGGVPMHILSNVVMTECATVAEAIELVRAAPIGSSSSLTLLDAERGVSLEITPVGVFEVPQREGAVIRTNHFQDPGSIAGEKPDFSPESPDRLALVQSRLAEGLPADADAMVQLLVSGEGEAPLTCVPDMSLSYGERWASLCTVITEPAARTIRILDGMPTEAATGTWRVVTV